MYVVQAANETSQAVAIWIRRNVIDAAPLWTLFYRSAVANLRTR
jgi:hypothetical protein